MAALLMAGSIAASAQVQSPFNPAGRWYISVQGGPMYQRNENSFVYEYNDVGGKLITYQAEATLGYDFTQTFGIRGSVEYGLNRGCANYWQTAAKGFYAYDFKNISAFVDGVLHFNGLNLVRRGFAPKIYMGIGLGHTFGFSKPDSYGTPHHDSWQGPFHPWQDVTEKNTVFGFRFGGILEYDLPSGIGFFGDLCGEAYTDRYNGLIPEDADHQAGTGYAGFPLDLRLTLFVGVTYRFR